MPDHPRDNLVRAIYPGYELRDGDNTTSPVLAGHAATWNTWTEINSHAEGHFLEQIQPGAFRKTIKENGDKVRVLFNHGNSQLGDMVLGPLRALEEDDTGMRYEVELLDGIPPLLINGLRAGEYGSSFRFSVVKDNWNRNPGSSDYNPDGLEERTLQEVRLFELGPVTFPAYPSATAGVRSMTDRFAVQREATLPEAEEPEPVEATPPEPEPQPVAETDNTREEKPSWFLE